jgi:hypothetical protein
MTKFLSTHIFKERIKMIFNNQIAARALEGAVFVATRGAGEEGGGRQSTLGGRWEVGA